MHIVVGVGRLMKIGLASGSAWPLAQLFGLALESTAIAKVGAHVNRTVDGLPHRSFRSSRITHQQKQKPAETGLPRAETEQKENRNKTETFDVYVSLYGKAQTEQKRRPVSKNRNRDRNVRAETQTETGLLGLIQINVEMQSLRQVAQPAAVVGQAVVKGVQIMAHVST
jgi:hypothetical protein